MEVKPKHLKVGVLGEDIACRYLKGKGFIIKDRNYRKKWGELDIIAEKAGRIRFIEVKSVSRVDSNNGDKHRPEDNIHKKKVERLRRVIQSYQLEHKVGEWQFDFLTVKIDENTRQAIVSLVEDVVI